MFTIVKEAWSHTDNEYAIKEVELHLKPEEALVLLHALRIYSESDRLNVGTDNRALAHEMHHNLAQRIADCGGRGEEYDS